MNFKELGVPGTPALRTTDQIHSGKDVAKKYLISRRK